MALLYYHGKIQSENLKIEAALHGAKFEGGPDAKPVPTSDEIMFKDPKEYEHLSPKERKALTKQMIGKLAGYKLPGMGKFETKTKRVKT